MNDGLLSLLGLCRKAGKLALGHDACKSMAVGRKAKLILICQDVSQRQKEEMASTAAREGNIPLLLDRSMQQVSAALGKSAGIIAVSDAGFAAQIIKLIQGGDTNAQ
ncbi:MAG TPA: ribosomal L7Ae/L30e/S12e/Gadd45 family protein [Clostridiales bacterium]|nr:ribosomal L7Ae/L30e/S12e/Gadd45 family protein [Clostridiales bacterium]